MGRNPSWWKIALDRFGGDSVVVWAGIHHGGRTALDRFGGDSVVVWAGIHHGGR